MYLYAIKANWALLQNLKCKLDIIACICQYTVPNTHLNTARQVLLVIWRNKNISRYVYNYLVGTDNGNKCCKPKLFVLGEDQIKLIFRSKPNLPTLIQFRALKKFVEILRKTNLVYYIGCDLIK